MGSRVFLSLLIALLLSTTAAAESYRWKDKFGELHYGEVVPPEYADQPYDIISEVGLVIGHVDPSKKSPEARAAAEKAKAEAEKALAQRQAQSDRMLLIKYPTEDALLLAMQMEIDQVGYDLMLIETSYANTDAAITDKVRLAADQQRAGIEVSETQLADFARLYKNLEIDRNKLASNAGREGEVREEFAAVQQRYRDLVQKYNEEEDQKAEQNSPTEAEPDSKDQS